MTQAVSILPEGWLYYGRVPAAIAFDGINYRTPGYKRTKWVMAAEVGIEDNHTLAVEVVYPGRSSMPADGSFLKEEWKLLDFVINALSSKIRHILSKKEIEKKHRQLDKAYQLAHIGTWEFDIRTHRLYWSPVTKEVHGFDEEYEPDLESTIRLFKEGLDRETFRRAAMDAIEKEKPFNIELKIVSGRGDERWIRATGEPEYKNGVYTRFYGISQDVTSRRQAEEDLQRSERRFRSLVQDGSDLIAILDSQGIFTYVSPTVESILGTAAEEYLGTNAFDYIHREDKPRIIRLLSILSSNQRVHIPPYRLMDSKGNWRWIETTLTDMREDPAVGGLVVNSRDVTEQIRQQHLNQESLKEKEILLAEIHHRVKNNLAVVSGMMQLQALDEDNAEIRDRLLDGISRIKTMASIHEQLYKSDSFTRLEFSDNIRSLVINIQQTFQSDAQIDIVFHCEPVQININQAIPCTLIINEAVTNIFKHAFRGREKGEITVCLSELGDNIVHLSIKDNGVGLPDHFDAARNGSLGLNLIDVLSQQLGADYNFDSGEKGTLFTIQFQRDEAKGIGNGILE